MKRLCLTLFLLVILVTSAFANDKLALKVSIGYARWIAVEDSDVINRGGGGLLGKFLYNLSPTISIGIESGIFFWRGLTRPCGRKIKTTIPFFLIAHFKIAGDEERLSYYLDLGIGAQGALIKGYGWRNEVMGFLITPGIELYISPALKLDIFVEIQCLSEFDLGGGGEAILMMIPSAGICF